MTNAFSNRFTKVYNVTHPFVGAGMAFAASVPDLAIAVAQAGGVGSIAAGPLPAEVIGHLIREVRSKTAQPINVNFITFLTSPEQIQVCIEEQVPIVSFHWGHPSKEMIEQLHRAGIKVWEQVGSVADAQKAVADGIDLIIAQGIEAGGHNYGTLPTFTLVPEIVNAVAPVPVLAAGGITTGRQVAAALCLGADGVWVGTRLLASPEAFIHPVYKEKLVAAAGTDTCLSSLFGPDMPKFNPMRVLHNNITRQYEGKENEIAYTEENMPIIGKANMFGQEIPLKRFTSFVPMPVTKGNLEEMPLLAGQGVGLVKEIKPAAAIVEEMMTEAYQTLNSFNR